VEIPQKIQFYHLTKDHSHWIALGIARHAPRDLTAEFYVTCVAMQEFMLGYLQCVSRNRGDGRNCEGEAKKYLTCRMGK
jgi:hypothetical protein